MHLAFWPLHHPITRGRPLACYWRILKYQLLTRTRREVVLPWIGGTRLAARAHMTGASGNLYYGLHEYSDMGFLIHFLRPEDLFVDVGANVGSWTVLASGLCGARSVTLEPDPPTARLLRRNVEINAIQDKVRVENVAAGREDGTASFTMGLGAINKFAGEEAEQTQQVPVRQLDGLLSESPTFIKIDVEGFEHEVPLGAGATLRGPNLRALMAEQPSDEVVEILESENFVRAWYDPATRNLSATELNVQGNNALVRSQRQVRRGSGPGSLGAETQHLRQNALARARSGGRLISPEMPRP